MNTIIISLAVLGGIGCLAAIILYVVAQTFKVNEDPRIDQIEAVLPGANCGGCGKPGCRGFAEACVKAGADYVKTSTGFGTGGATAADVALMKASIPASMKVKAAGGMHSWQEALAMVEAGASRLGTSSTLKIVEGAEE